jgi:hypothetical protein
MKFLRGMGEGPPEVPDPSGPVALVNVVGLLRDARAVSDHRVLLVRLPCNPIFPIGPIYLADHLHK